MATFVYVQKYATPDDSHRSFYRRRPPHRSSYPSQRPRLHDRREEARMSVFGTPPSDSVCVQKELLLHIPLHRDTLPIALSVLRVSSLARFAGHESPAPAGQPCADAWASRSVVQSVCMWCMVVVPDAESRQGDPTGCHHEEEHDATNGNYLHHVVASSVAHKTVRPTALPTAAATVGLVSAARRSSEVLRQ